MHTKAKNHSTNLILSELWISRKKYYEQFKDEWADAAGTKINFVHGLPTADAMYHNICIVNFRTGKHIPKLFKRTTEIKPTKETEISASGRPKDTEKRDVSKQLLTT